MRGISENKAPIPPPVKEGLLEAIIMKGVAPVLTHSIFVAITIMALGLISLTLLLLYNESIKQSISTQLSQVNQQIADEIFKLYQSGKKTTLKPEPNRSALLGRTELYIPQKISGRKYYIRLEEMPPSWIYVTNFSVSNTTTNATEERPYARVISRTVDPGVEVFMPIRNLEIELQGLAEGDRQPLYLEYYRYNFENTIYDKITLGSPRVLISVEGAK